MNNNKALAKKNSAWCKLARGIPNSARLKLSSNGQRVQRMNGAIFLTCHGLDLKDPISREYVQSQSTQDAMHSNRGMLPCGERVGRLEETAIKRLDTVRCPQMIERNGHSSDWVLCAVLDWRNSPCASYAREIRCVERLTHPTHELPSLRSLLL